MLEAEALKLSNQARFILEKCDGSLKIENKKKKVMIADLERKNFDPGKPKICPKNMSQKYVDTQFSIYIENILASQWLFS